MNTLFGALFKRYSETFISKWTILFLDAIFVWSLYPLAVLIRENLEAHAIDVEDTILRSLIVLSFYLLSFLLIGSYKSVVRQTGIKDTWIVTQASFLGFIISMLVGIVASSLTQIEILHFSKGALVIHFFISLFFLISFRFVVKASFLKMRNILSDQKKVNVIIYGSGELGEITRNSLSREASKTYKLHCFIDDNSSKIGKKQDGVSVKEPYTVLNADYLEKHQIHQLVIAINKMDKQRKRDVIEKCMELKLEVKIVPPVESWIQNDFSYKEIKNVAIEDLLGREPINLKNPTLSKEIARKSVMITGAAGSIGSEISRQVIHYKPSKVVLCDIAESNLYELQMEIQRKWPELAHFCEFVVLDITRKGILDAVISRVQPDIIYHAAAYKHVPLMEQHPEEAARVNILGTKNLADLACKYKVSKFVMVSTDKAINPTNVMGASKRVAEMYVQSKNLNGFYKTSFITTRFGNVLGSNGSVVPLFKKQIEEGGPVCVTHPEITRYFMTIPEACNLVLEAGSIGCNGQILVFDMGASVKIKDLAVKMIKLMGLEPEKDIKIIYTGLRPGEKLMEELISAEEDNQPTHHPKIMISKTKTRDNFIIAEGIATIEEAVLKCSSWEVVKAIKQMVPEYKSNNSKYESIDKELSLLKPIISNGTSRAYDNKLLLKRNDKNGSPVAANN